MYIGIYRYIHLIYIDVYAYIYEICLIICDIYDIQHMKCVTNYRIYHTHYIHTLSIHMYTHIVLYIDFSHKLSKRSHFKINSTEES